MTKTVFATARIFAEASAASGAVNSGALAFGVRVIPAPVRVRLLP